MRRQLCATFCAALTTAVVMVTPARAQIGTDATFAAFLDAVKQYLALQQRIQTELPPLTVTDSSGTISSLSNALAAAVERARPKARPGDFFDAAAAREISMRLREALKGTDVVHFLAVINDEPALKGPPRVHMRFPGASSMATMPTNVLDVLPALPRELEYRFLGRSLVLRDRDAALIIDYMPQALPAR